MSTTWPVWVKRPPSFERSRLDLSIHDLLFAETHQVGEIFVSKTGVWDCLQEITVAFDLRPVILHTQCHTDVSSQTHTQTNTCTARQSEPPFEPSHNSASNGGMLILWDYIIMENLWNERRGKYPRRAGGTNILTRGRDQHFGEGGCNTLTRVVVEMGSMWYSLIKSAN
jgi:hypothetical protein